MDTVISFVDNLPIDGLLVLGAHVLAWFYCAQSMWDMSDMPSVQLADIRQQFASSDVSKPLVLVANTWWRRLLRECSLVFCFWALVSNYIQGHKSFGVAATFLVVAILGVEVFSRFNRRRYRHNLNVCDQTYRAQAASRD